MKASVPALVRLSSALRLTPADNAPRSSIWPASATLTRRFRTRPICRRNCWRCPQAFQDPPICLIISGPARAWNEAASDLFAGWLDPETSERNLLTFVFLSPRQRTLIGNWQDRARRLAAEFRADFNRHPTMRRCAKLVADLTAKSPEFARLWKAQSVLGREGGERDFNHPARGALSYHQTTLLIAARPDVKLSVSCSLSFMSGWYFLPLTFFTTA